MPAEPSQDARADQPTETICMFTLRGDNHERAASDLRGEADELCEVYQWTQATRVVPEHSAYFSDCAKFDETYRPTHGPALTPRGHDFMKMVRCVWYVVGRFGMIGLCWCFVEIVRRVVIQIDW